MTATRPRFLSLAQALALMGIRRRFPRCENCGARIRAGAVVCEHSTLCRPCWCGGTPVGALTHVPAVRPLNPADN